MSFLSKKIKKSDGHLVDLSDHSDADLHCLMDSVTAEMARRASVKAKEREFLRRLENLAVSEGVTLEEMRGYIKAKSKGRVEHLQPVFKFDEQPQTPKQEELPVINTEPTAKPKLEPFLDIKRDENLESQFERLLQRELS